MTTRYELPEPEDVAEQIVEEYSGDGEGVLRDSLIDAQIQAFNYAYQIQEAMMVFDYALDDPGIYPGVVYPPRLSRALNDCYQTTCTLHDFFAGLAEALEEEIENV